MFYEGLQDYDENCRIMFYDGQIHYFLTSKRIGLGW